MRPRDFGSGESSLESGGARAAPEGTVLSWEAILTLLVILSSLGLMMSNLASPDLVLLIGVVILLSAGVITSEEAFSGFSNTGMLTVAALFVVAAGLRETGAVNLVAGRLLGRPESTRGALIRLAFPVMGASAFLNNTTIVASLLPAVHDWARRIGVAPSRLLLPLSYAAIVGGLITLIGTSTNLVVAGLVEERLADTPGLHSLGLFEVTPLGLVLALGGGVVMVVLGPVLLPDRRPAVSRSDDPRHYTMEVIVPPGSRLDKRSIEEAGLRSLPGAFLMEIIRGEEIIAVVDSNQRLEVGDRLVLVGDLEAIVDLQRFPGLAAAPDQVFKMEGARHVRHIVEAVVSDRNPILGMTIREGGFRNRYRSVVIAVARNGERVAGRIGDITLKPGDVLLLEANPDFVSEQRSRTDFYLVSQVEGATPPRYERAYTALAIMVALVATVSFELVSTVTAAFLAAAATVLTRCCTLEEARRSLEVPVLVAIAASFGLGKAMQSTGLDKGLIDIAFSMGADHPMLALVVVYLCTVVLTEVITNNAAAVLALPLGLAMAERLGVSPMPFVFAVMVAASASFMTPIGYQTNLMVMGAGGYKPSDYPRLGLPLSLTVGVLALVLIPVFWPFTGVGS